MQFRRPVLAGFSGSARLSDARIRYLSWADARDRVQRACDAAPTSVARLVLGDAGELHRRPVGKPRDERQAPAHGLDRPAQRREQEIAALLQPPHRVLADAELAGDADLGEVAGLAQLAQMMTDLESDCVERKESAADQSFDSRPADGIELEDLDIDFLCNHYLPAAVAAEVPDRNRRTIEQQLRSLRLVQADRPTWGALLAFGRDPQGRLPGACVQFLRIDGVEVTDPIRNRKQLTGRLDDVVRRLDDLLGLNVSVRTEVVGARRERRQPDYPVDALRQPACNAVMHRSYQGTNAPVRAYWYAGRIDIASPDGLYGRMTRENFGAGDTDYRNPLLAGIMHHLGYAQRFGPGVPLARRLLAENGNPEPEFHFEQAHVFVTVRTAP